MSLLKTNLIKAAALLLLMLLFNNEESRADFLQTCGSYQSLSQEKKAFFNNFSFVGDSGNESIHFSRGQNCARMADVIRSRRRNNEQLYVIVSNTSNSALDLSPLAEIDYLTRISIDCHSDFFDTNRGPGEVIGDFVAAFRNKPDLEFIELRHCMGIDRFPLDRLKGLRHLTIASSPLVKIPKYFLQLIHLRSLSLDRTEISDLEGLHRMIALEGLSINAKENSPESKRIRDLSPLMSLVNLQSLSIDGFPELSSLNGVQYMQNLKSVTIGRGLVSDLSPLTSLPWLEKLNLSRNQVKDVTLLRHFNRLKDLTLFNTPIPTVKPLQDLPLQSLIISGAKANDYHLIGHIQTLKYLSIKSSSLRDISFLEHLPKVQFLELIDNKITNFSPLSAYLKADPFPDIYLGTKPLDPNGQYEALRIDSSANLKRFLSN